MYPCQCIFCSKSACNLEGEAHRGGASARGMLQRSGPICGSGSASDRLRKVTVSEAVLDGLGHAQVGWDKHRPPRQKLQARWRAIRLQHARSRSECLKTCSGARSMKLAPRSTFTRRCGSGGQKLNRYPAPIFLEFSSEKNEPGYTKIQGGTS